jgi:hypothetical protein
MIGGHNTALQRLKMRQQESLINARRKRTTYEERLLGARHAEVEHPLCATQCQKVLKTAQPGECR